MARNTYADMISLLFQSGIALIVFSLSFYIKKITKFILKGREEGHKEVSRQSLALSSLCCVLTVRHVDVACFQEEKQRKQLPTFTGFLSWHLLLLRKVRLLSCQESLLWSVYRAALCNTQSIKIFGCGLCSICCSKIRSLI